MPPICGCAVRTTTTASAGRRMRAAALLDELVLERVPERRVSAQDELVGELAAEVAELLAGRRRRELLPLS